MFADFLSLPKTAVRVFVKPSEHTFAQEKERFPINLQVAFSWIVLLSAMGTLLRLYEAALIDEWILYGYVQDWKPQSKFVEAYHLAMMEVTVISTYLHLEMVSLYARWWAKSGLFDYLADPVYRFGSFFLYEIPEWARITVKIVLSPAFFVIKAGAYHCIATLFGGRGQFRHYVYFLVVIAVPTSIINKLLDFLPLVIGRAVAILSNSTLMVDQDWFYMTQGPIGNVSTIAIVYWIALFYLATKMVYGLSRWRAFACTVTFYPLNFLLSSSLPYVYVGLFEAANFFR